MTEPALDDIAGYYAAKLAEHGETPRGVDWNGAEGQTLRFEQLARVIARDGRYSVNDLGCGYGALYDHLAARHTPAPDYQGVDIAQAMIAAAQARHPALPPTAFITAAAPDRVADYGMASGIFNVRLDRDNDAWRAHIEATLDTLDRTSRLGFAFNCLTAYSDADRMRADLHYADPLVLFDLCKRRYARNVALLHDYGLYEFTILVRKQP